LPKEIADQIVDRTDGIPLLIEELTKNVVESGMVTDTGDRYAAAGPITPLAIPFTRRCWPGSTGLAPTREIAQIGAALGRSFSHEMIGAVAAMPQRQKRATTTIPIVMAPVGDPVRAGFVSSLAHAGGNITGVSLYASELSGKRVR
jgi:hypothetical protein